MAPRAVPAPTEPPELTVAFGGGGPFGIAYGLGVADGLRDSGLSFEGVNLLGTSAGAWVASSLATGVGFADLCVVPQLRLPSLRPGLLRDIAADLFGDAQSEHVTASAVHIPRGRRVMLRGDTYRLADIVAASSAVPGLFAPTRLDGGLYVDGGVRSMVSADHAQPARHLLVVAPIAGRMFGPGGQLMELMLRGEVRRWHHATGGRAYVLRPNAEIASLVQHPLQVFDKDGALAAYPLAYAQAQRLVGEWPSLAALVTGRGAAA